MHLSFEWWLCMKVFIFRKSHAEFVGEVSCSQHRSPLSCLLTLHLYFPTSLDLFTHFTKILFFCTFLKKKNTYSVMFYVVIERKGGSRTATTSKMERFLLIVNGFNYYHKALHFGCCSSPRSASGKVTLT